MFAWGITFSDYSLHRSIVGVTVWYLGSPNYILVSCLCLLYLCPVMFVLYFVPFQQSTHYVSHSLLLAIYPYLLNICLFFCYNYPLAKYILRLILALTCSSCASLLPYIPSLWVQLFKHFRSISSVFTTTLSLCFKFIKLYSCNYLAIVYGNWKIHQMIRKVQHIHSNPYCTVRIMSSKTIKIFLFQLGL